MTSTHVRTLPTTTLDLADLWLMEDETSQNEDPNYDPDDEYGRYGL